MFRSRNERQSESARKYLDFAAVSPALEHAAEVTAHALDFPIVLVNILDDSNQHTLVAYGADEARGRVVPLSRSACRAVVELGRPIVVEDSESAPAIPPSTTVAATATASDALLAELKASGLRSYAAIPIFGRESVAIGTLCLLDARPRVLGPERFRLLEQLAVMVEEHLDVQRARTRVAAASATVAELTAAVDDGEITPWYEPIVDLRSGSVYALEALARWAHPSRGLVPPGSFIEQMESTDLIIDLDLRILDRALSDFGKWIVEYPELKLSVNISGHHLERGDCVERITHAVDTSGIDPQSVILEITETARGVAVRHEARIVSALRDAGFTVMLDDLGSGWSPVPRLTHVSIDGFKLDRSVAAALHTKIGDALAQAMLHFAGELGHDVVLEGIETSSRLARARALGFSYGQGHCFSKAIAAEDVAQLLACWRSSDWVPASSDA